MGEEVNLHRRAIQDPFGCNWCRTQDSGPQTYSVGSAVKALGLNIAELPPEPAMA